MKLIACLGAAALVAMIPVEASAAPQTMSTTTVKNDRNGTTTRTVTRNRSTRGGWHWQTKCKTSWHHGRKTRTCRKVRTHW